MARLKRKPLCRNYYYKMLIGQAASKCKRGKKCTFDHPSQITSSNTSEYNRDLGYCYCGAPLKSIINKNGNEEEEPYFFKVCARTMKSINKCAP